MRHLASICIEHFSPPFRADRLDRPGGGVIVYVRDTLPSKYLDCYSLSFKPFTPHTKLLYHYVCPRFEDPSSLTGNSFHIPDLLSGLILIFLQFLRCSI